MDIIGNMKEGQMVSTYDHDYPKKVIEWQKEADGNFEEMEKLQTEYKDDMPKNGHFSAKKVVKWEERDEGTAGVQEFDRNQHKRFKSQMESTYDHDYPKKEVKWTQEVDIQELERDHLQYKSKAKTGESVYDHDFVEFDVNNAEQNWVDLHNIGKDIHGVFSGKKVTVQKSSYEDDFRPVKVYHDERKTGFEAGTEARKDFGNGEVVKKVKFEGETVYHHDFPGWNPEEKGVVEKGPEIQRRKMMTESQYKREYRGQSLDLKKKRNNLRDLDLMQLKDFKEPRKVKMEDESTFKRDYPGHQISPNKWTEKKARNSYQGKFHSQTAYDRDYPEYEIDLLRDQKIDAGLLANNNKPLRNKAKFQSSTIYTEDYIKKEGSNKNNLNSKNTRDLPATKKPKFNANTSYKVDYPGHEANESKLLNFESQTQNSIPQIPEPSHKVQMQTETTFKRDYPGHQPQLKKALKQPMKSSIKAKMLKESSYGKDYVKYKKTPQNNDDDYYDFNRKLRNFEARRKQNKKGSSLEAGKKTQYQEDYPGHQPTAQNKIKVFKQKNKAQFQGKTTYGDEYVEKKQKISKDSNILEFPTYEIKGDKVKMENLTTFQEDYPQYEVESHKLMPKNKFLKPIGKMKGVSSYGAEYVEHEIKPSNLAPHNNLDNYQTNPKLRAKIRTETQYVEDYPEHPQERPANYELRDQVQYPKKSTQFNGKSIYIQDYPEHQIAAGSPTAEDDNQVEIRYLKKPKFKGKSTAQRDFIEHEIPAQDFIKMKSINYRRPVKMANKTAYGNDFVEYELDRRNENPRNIDNIMRAGNEGKNRQKIDDHTVYRDEYVGYEIQQKAREEPTIRAPKAPFKDKTSYNHDYIKHNPNLEDKNLIKISEQYNISAPQKAKMENKTTFQQDYKGHKPSSQKVRKAALKKPIGKMENKTSYNTQYVEHPFEKVNHIEGDTDINTKKRKIPKFEGETQYAENYKGHDIDQNPQILKDSEIKLKKPDFKGNTTYGIDFEQYQLNNEETDPQITENPYPQLKSKQPMEMTTTFTRDFNKHKIAPQKAVEIKSHKPVGKMNLETQYQTNFKEYDIEGLAQPLVDDYDDVRAFNRHQNPKQKLKFADSTVYNSEFVGHNIEERYRSQPVMRKRTGKFKGTTTYGEEFEPKKLREKKLIPLVYDSGEGIIKPKMENVTTFMGDYTGFQPEKSKIIKRSRKSPIGKLAQKTSYGQDYINYEGDDINRRVRPQSADRIPRNRNLNKSKCTWKTQYQDEYFMKELDKDQPTVERIGFKEKPGKFEGKTTYNSEYWPKKNDNGNNELEIVYPEKVNHRGKFRDETTNKADFYAHPISTEKDDFNNTFRVNWNNGAKQDLRTSYGMDFIEFDPNSAEFKTYPMNQINPPINQSRPQMETTTAYNDEFIKFDLEKKTREEAKRPSKQSKFKGESTYDHDFIKMNMKQYHSEQPGDYEIKSQIKKMPKVKFEERTTYDENYKEFDVQPPHSLKRKKNLTKSSLKMDLRTNYDEEFKSYKIQKRVESDNANMEQIKGKKKKKPKFNGKTSYNSNYVGHKLKKRKQNKPIEKRKKQKFNGRTTYGNDFDLKELEKKETGVHAPQQFEGSKFESKFQGKTHYQDNYVGHEVKPKNDAKLLKKSKNRKSRKMENKTHYQQNFDTKTSKLPVNIQTEAFDGEFKQRKNKKKIKFEGTTSYQDNYLEHKIDTSQPKKHQKRIKKSKFKGETTYQSNFIEKKINNKEENHLEYPSPNPATKSKRAKFRGRTSYQDNFNLDSAAQKDSIVQPKPRKKRRKMKRKLDGRTTYNTNFEKYDVKEVNQINKTYELKDFKKANNRRLDTKKIKRVSDGQNNRYERTGGRRGISRKYQTKFEGITTYNSKFTNDKQYEIETVIHKKTYIY